MSDEKGGLPPKKIRMPDEIVRSIRRYAELIHDTVTELEPWEQFFLGDQPGISEDLNNHANEILMICNEKLRETDPPALGSAAADGA